MKASAMLSVLKPGWKIVIFDALRPLSAQKELWEAVRGTANWKYVATPGGTSLHNYGLAIDVTLEDEYGNRLDMGSDYDEFSQISEPRHEEAMLREGKLTSLQVANRRFLRDIMKRAGWRTIKNEWWHFEALRREHVKGKYKLIQ
jgi:D-alanyl-D-alanine dipeptidase